MSARTQRSATPLLWLLLLGLLAGCAGNLPQTMATASVPPLSAYLKLDRSGKWADVARRQLERLQQATVIQTSR